jgi:hypothetical protein
MARPEPRRLVLWLVALFVLGSPLVAVVPAGAAAPPVLTGVADDAGPTSGGDVVTLHGAGLLGTYVVSFGGVRTSHLHVWSSTEITVRAPAHGRGTVSVRVARPGSASAATTLARYSYVDAVLQTPRPLTPRGITRPAPPVSTIRSTTQQVAVDLTCTSDAFCVAVGDLGLSTWNGTSWSAVTPTTPGTQRPRVACGNTIVFCMAAATDGSWWRYLNSTWTRLGSRPGVVSISCTGTLCLAEAGHRVYTYENGAWDAGQAAITGGVSGVACAWNGCVVTSASGYYRIRSAVTGEWSVVHPMWNSAALRASTLTRGATGSLQCEDRAHCMSLGQPDPRTGVEHFALFTGRTWSTGLTHLTTAAAPRRGSSRLVQCLRRQCLEVTEGTDASGRTYHDWVRYEGTLRSRAADAAATRAYDAVYCRDECLGLTRGTFGFLD